MTRVIDLLAFVIVAVVLLLPAPSITVSAAVAGERADLDHLAELEDQYFRDSNAQVAVELARAYLTVGHPAWALSTLLPYLKDGNYTAYQVAAHAYAERLEPAEALRAAESGQQACEAAGPRCSEVSRIRLAFLAQMMRQLVAQNVDPHKDPLRARQLVREALRGARAPVPR